MPYTRGRTARVIPIRRRRRGMGDCVETDAGVDCSIDTTPPTTNTIPFPQVNPTTPTAPTTPGIASDITSILNSIITVGGTVAKAVVTTPTYTYTTTPNGTVITSTGGAAPASVLNSSSLAGIPWTTIGLIVAGLFAVKMISDH